MNLKKKISLIFCVAFFISFSANAVFLSEKTVGRLTNKQLFQRVESWLKNKNMTFDFRPFGYEEEIQDRLYKAEIEKGSSEAKAETVASGLIEKMVLRRAVTASDRERLLKDLEKLRAELAKWKKLAGELKGKAGPGQEGKVQEVVQQLKEGELDLGEAAKVLKGYKITTDELKQAVEDAGFTPEEIEEMEEEEDGPPPPPPSVELTEEDWQEVKNLLTKWGKINQFDDVEAIVLRNLDMDDLQEEFKKIGFMDQQAEDLAIAAPAIEVEEEEEEEEEELGWEEFDWGNVEEFLKLLGLEDKIGEIKKNITEKSKNPGEVRFDEHELKIIFKNTYNLDDAQANNLILLLQGKEVVMPKGPPKPLTQQEIQVLTAAEKKASDALFIDALREMPFAFDGAGTFDQYLKFILDTLKKKVRTKEEFKKREDFDKAFVKTPEENFEKIKKTREKKGFTGELPEQHKKGLFASSMRLTLQDEFKKLGADKFLSKKFKDFVAPAKNLMLSRTKKALASSLFDKTALNQLENQIMLMVVNLITGLRKAETPNYAPDSDEVVEDLFVDLRDLQGVFNLPGHAEVEKFASILEEFKDDRGFYKDVTLDQADKLIDAYRKLKEDDVVKTLWPEELKKLDDAVNRITEAKEALAKFLELLNDYDKQKLAQGKNKEEFVKDFKEFESKAKNVFLDKYADSDASKNFNLLSDEANYNFRKPRFSKIVFSVAMKKALERYKINSVDLLNVETFITPIKDFHNILLRKRFSILRDEINRLRLNPKFKRYDKLLNRKDEVAYQALVITVGKASPILSILFDFDLDTSAGRTKFGKELLKTGFLTPIQTQLFASIDGWKSLLNEKSDKFKKTVGQVLEEVLDAFRGFKLAQKGEFDVADFLEEIVKVEKVSQLNKILSSLKRKKVNQEQLEEIIKGIKKGEDPSGILEQIRTLVRTQEAFSNEAALQKMLEEKQEEAQAIQKIIRVIQDWIGYSPQDPNKKLKLEPSAEELFQEFLQKFEGLKSELEDVFKNIFRTPNTVKDWLNSKLKDVGGLKRLTKEDVGKFNEDYLIDMVQPYGLLLKILDELQKSKLADKVKRQTLHKLLVDLNNARTSAETKKFGATSQETGLIEAGVYKGKLENIINSIKTSNLGGFRSGVSDIVSDANLQIEDTDEYQNIIKGALGFLAGEAYTSILDGLKTLNRGRGFFGEDLDKNIIPGMEIKVPEFTTEVTLPQTKLNANAIKLLEGKLKEILDMIDTKDKLKVLDLSDGGQFSQKIAAVKQALVQGIAGLTTVPRGMTDFDAQKKRVSEIMSNYLDQIPGKLRGIKANL